ncbi:MAG TPA: hypothetical protein VJB14_15700, partial [Planctomycetota bacterium]|nr:hypothetical protein [Planctomycetota bacterium]
MRGWMVAIATALLASSSDGHAQAKETLSQRLKRLVEAVNVEDNPKVEFPGEGFQDLPPEALPLLKEALKRKDLKWTARTCIAAGIRRIDERAKKLDWAAEFEAQKKEVQRLVGEEFKRVGRRDPKWDKPALEAVEAAVAAWSSYHRRRPEDGRRAREASQAAIQAGCDDPLILYITARMMLDAQAGTPQEKVEAHEAAAKALDSSPYHPMLRSRGHKMAAEILLFASGNRATPEAKAKILGELREALRLFGEALQADPALLGETIVDHAKGILGVWGALEDRKNGFDPLHAAIKKARPKSALPDLLAGLFQITYAWDARGSGWAKDVKPEAWELFRARLAEARTRLAAAWKIDPTDVRVPQAMMSVLLGGDAPRDEMELWFGRGMEVFPDSYALCLDKLYYLEPKWHGSPAEILQFGRQCALTGNWEGSVPWTLLEAHKRLAQYGPGGWKPEPDYAYFEKPAAWEDVRSLYARYLKLHPDSAGHRVNYAFYAGHAKRWKEAKEQFDLLGETPARLGAFDSQDDYARARAKAAEESK